MPSVIPPGYVPVYPADHYVYQQQNGYSINNPPHTMYNNYSNSAPNLSTLSSSPPNSGLTVPSSPHITKSTLISGPPAAHYMHNNNN